MVQRRHSRARTGSQSSSHPRPHPHADIHDRTTGTGGAATRKKRSRRIDPLNVYQEDGDAVVPGTASRPVKRQRIASSSASSSAPPSSADRDRRFDWDSQENYQYALPDEYEDEEVDEDAAFDQQDEERYGELLHSIAQRRQGRAAAGSKRKGAAKLSSKTGKAERKSRLRRSDEEAEDAGSEVRMHGEDGDAAAAGIDEDDELEEGMTTLSALLDEPDDEAEEPGGQQQQQRRTAAASSRSLSSKHRGRAAVRAKNAGSAEEEEVVVEAGEEREEDVEYGDGDDDEEDEEEEDEDAAAVSVKRSRLLSMVQALDAEGRQRAQQADSADRTTAAAESALEESEFAAISLPSSSSAAQRQRRPTLTLQALMQSLPAAGENGRTVAALKRRLAALTGTASSSSSSGPAAGALPEPLPEVRQEELTRRLGYERLQKEIERWAPIVERNMTATTLHFPLHAPPVHAHSSASMQAQFHSSSSHRLEQELAAIMKEYGLKGRGAGGGDGGVESTEAEQLRARELTAEEVQRRRAELGKLKSLLFHAELKQRRINRIKSRTYRRLRKRQRERAELSLEELQQVDPEEAERRRMKAELERVRERMTLSHTNSSAWMRRQLRLQQQSGGGNAEVKQAMQQAAVIKQRLRQKQQPDDDAEDEEAVGRPSDEDDTEGDDAEEEEEEEDEEEPQSSSGMSKAQQLKAALRELERERSSEDEEEKEEAVGFDPPSDAAAGRQSTGPSSSGSRSSVLGLKFMQRAMEQKRQQTKEARQQLAEELKEQLQREGMDTDEEPEEEKAMDGRTVEAEEKSSETARGRRKVGAEPADEAMLERSGDTRSFVQLLPNSFQAVQADRAVRVDGFIDIEQELQQQQAVDAASPSSDAHQALPAQATKAGGIRGATAAVQAAGGNPVTVAAAPHRRRAGRYYDQQEEKDGSSPAGTEAVGEREEENPWAQATDVSARKELREEAQKKRRRRRQRQGDRQQQTEDAASAAATAVPLPVNIDVRAVLHSSNNSTAAPSSSSSPNQLSLLEDEAADDEQSALVAEAFATGEDEEANFTSMKAAVVQASLPQMDSVLAPALPGWGSWTGEGVRPAAPSARQQQQQREAQRRLLQLQQRALSARSDRALPHVLISEKSERRASKYLLQRLPFPFTSVDAYEQSLLQPLGKEWNSQQAHLNVITPSVVVKKGAVIEPIDYQHSARDIHRDDDKDSGQPASNRRSRQRGGADTGARGRRKEADAKTEQRIASASAKSTALPAAGSNRVTQRRRNSAVDSR